MKKKLSKKDIMRIPSMSKTLKGLDIAAELRVHISSINYWKRVLRASGIKMKIKKGRRPLKLQ